MPDTWKGIQPGDIGFDRGGGFVGFLIRTFTHSPFAHCWVWHRVVKYDENGDPLIWETAEAYPGGLKLRERPNANVNRVVRTWRTEEERQNTLAKSESLVGMKYNYRELFRIIHSGIRDMSTILSIILVVGLISIFGLEMAVGFWAVACVVLGLALLYASLPLKTKLNKRAVICSNHVAQSVLAGREDVYMARPPQSIWPGRLSYDLNITVWNDYYANPEIKE